MHHIFVDKKYIENDIVKIDKTYDAYNYNHLVNSLRIAINEKVLCSVIPFNSEYDYLSEVVEITKDEVLLKVIEKKDIRELPVKINLYQGLVKSDKMELIIEKAVELGVFSVTPVINDYSIVKYDEDKEQKKLDRYNKISKSAAEQSKRNIIPKINETIKYKELISKLNSDEQALNILFYENATDINKTKKIFKDYMMNRKDLTINVIIGPEGGFSDIEIENAKNNGINILSLGNRILRTETAAITALSILEYEFEV